MMRRWLLAVVAAAAFVPAHADILLDGHNHVGNCDDTGGGCTGFTPLDPVSRDNMFNTPYAFHLTTTTTIDKVRLDNPISLDGKLQIYIQPLFGSRVFRSGSLSGSTYDLIPDVVLTPGYYSLLPDGGCSDLIGGTYFYSGCSGSGDNDHGYSSVTLVSAQTTTSRMLIQRRHPGNPTDPANDNDQDDDYDFSDTGAPYYPDIAEGHPLDMTFNIDANRRLSEIRFYRARDVDGYPNTISVDGFVAGSIPDTGDPLEVNPSVISTNQLLLAGNHTLRVALGVISGDDVDSFSWDSIILQFVDAAPAGSLGRFNATDTAEPPLNGVIKTKISNKGFELDLHAIDPLGTGVNTSYTGTVNVELLDASDDSGGLDIYGCRTSWGQSVVYLLGSATFAGSDNGKMKIAGVKYPNALKAARVRITDTVTGAQGCSTDALAIRPKDFQASASDNDWQTAGTARALPSGAVTATTTPVHKAGRPFTLRVTPRQEGGGTATGYDGQPEVTAVVAELGTVIGTVSAPGASWYWSSGELRNDAVTYNEAGAVRLRIEDSTFADVDIADSTLSERTIKKEDLKVGRFVPDNLEVTALHDATPGCGTFTYIGQPISFTAGAVTLTARAYSATPPGPPTLNYTGILGFASKLATVGAAAFAIYDDPGIAGTPALDVPGGNHAVTDNGDGTGTIQVADFTVVRAAAPMPEFTAEIGMDFPAFTDSDGVPTSVSPISHGTDAPGSGIPFTGGAKLMRYGRLYIQPSFGSDREALAVPMRTEYWDGVSFLPSNAATCTPLVAGDVTATNLAGGQTVGLTPSAVPDAGWTIDLSAPGDARVVGLSIDVDTVGPYLFLRDDSDADGNFDNDPAGTASFGFYDRSGDNRIFQREVFR